MLGQALAVALMGGSSLGLLNRGEQGGIEWTGPFPLEEALDREAWHVLNAPDRPESFVL